MARPRSASRVVSFWEVTDTEYRRLRRSIAWPEVLAYLRDLPYDVRAVRFGTSEISIEALQGVGGADLLALSSHREDDWPGLLDRMTGTRSELHLPDNNVLAETSHFAYFDHNVIGMLRGPQGSPSASALVAVLEGVARFPGFDGRDLRLRPVVRPSIRRRIESARHARAVHLSLPTDILPQLDIGGAAGDLLGPLRAMGGSRPRLHMELRLSLETRKRKRLAPGDRRAAEQMLADALEIADSPLAESLQAGEVKVVDPESDRVQVVDFVNDRIVHRQRVPLPGRARSVTDDVAADALQRAWEQNRAEILASIGVDL